MKNIPKISFLKTDKTEIEFEILTFNDLFSRQDRFTFRIDKPHRVNFYHILYITKGSGVHHIDFKPYNYKEGSILFISEEQVHEFEIIPENDGFLILFTEAFLSKNMIHSDIVAFYRLINYHLHLPIIQPEEIKNNNFINNIYEIYHEYRSYDDFAKNDIIRLLLKLILFKMERIKRTLITSEKKTDWLFKFGMFRKHLQKHFTETRNATEYAEMMNISYKHLNEICKSITGNTAKDVINKYLILEIKRQLSIFDISVKELTYKLGFDEPTNFVKFFKKHTGHSPSQFKHILTK